MSAIAALTINDGQATPVAHTFNPVNIDSNGVAKWADRVGGIALGYPIVSHSLKTPSPNGSRNYKLQTNVLLPVLEVTSPSTSTGIQPAPTLAYTLSFRAEWSLPERSTAAQRADILAFAKNYLANAVVGNAVNNFESVY